MDAEKSVQEKKRELREAEMATKITLEEKNRELVSLAAANAREEADSRAYAVSAITKPLSEMDTKALEALTSVGMQPGQLDCPGVQIIG